MLISDVSITEPLVSQFRASVGGFLIALLALVCGYKRDFLEHSFDTALSWLEPAPVVEPSSPVPVATEQTDTMGAGLDKPAVANSLNSPYQDAFPMVTPASNPEAPSLKPKGPKKPFGGTFEAIKQNKIADHQKRKRNKYFEKLSKQMKALKGEDRPRAPIGTAKNRKPRPRTRDLSKRLAPKDGTATDKAQMEESDMAANPSMEEDDEEVIDDLPEEDSGDEGLSDDAIEQLADEVLEES